MASGLIALLDDVALIAKLAAASLDDVGAAAGKAGTKAAGVVIDDAAVAPTYVVGFTPDRELPIIWKIAKGSLRNKLLLLLPAFVAMAAFAPWALTPLLMIGGAYLCYEAAEKVIEKLGLHAAHAAEGPVLEDPVAREGSMVGGAIRTDLILSAEILAIALGTIAEQPLLNQAIVLALVSIVVTAGVYGAVALIVKMDDIGVRLARQSNGGVQALGRGLVNGMPALLSVLSVVGTAAMAWVGGGILVHGLEHYGLDTLPHWIHGAADSAAAAVPVANGFVGWFVSAFFAGILGLVVGAVVVGSVTLGQKIVRR